MSCIFYVAWKQHTSNTQSLCSTCDWGTHKVSMELSRMEGCCILGRKELDLNGPSGLQQYWYDLCREMKICPRRVQWGQSVMIWELYPSVGLLIWFDYKATWILNTIHTFYKNRFLQYSEYIVDVDWIFEKEKAAMHFSNYTRTYTETNDVLLLNRSEKSSDSNIMSNVWSVLALEVCWNGHQFHNIFSLQKPTMTAWNEIYINYLRA